MPALNDVLDALVARTVTPSALGPQLERLRDGVQVTSDPHRVRDAQHDKLLADADLYRCIDGLCGVDRCTFSRITPTIEKLAIRAGLPTGLVSVNILRAYQERRTGLGEERALVAVYEYLRHIDPRHFPPLMHDQADATQAFREGKAKTARRRALELHADAHIVLGKWVELWNEHRSAKRKRGRPVKALCQVS